MIDPDTGRDLPARTWFWQKFLSRLLDQAMTWAVVGGVFGALIWLSEDRRDHVQRMWNIPEQVELIGDKVQIQGEQLTRVSDAVRRLQIPSRVFELSTSLTRPVDGYCVEDQPCDVQIVIRRLESALDCRIMPETARWGFVGSGTEIAVYAERLDEPVGRNITAAFTRITVTLHTPTDLSPVSDFFFDVEYVNCPGMHPGDEPVRISSVRIPFTVVKEAPQDD